MTTRRPSVFDDLMNAIDSNIFRTPEREIDKPFLMPVEDVFSITGRGTVGDGTRWSEGKIVKDGRQGRGGRYPRDPGRPRW